MPNDRRRRRSEMVTVNRPELSAETSWRLSLVARRYSVASGKKVAKALREMKRGVLKSGRSGRTVRTRQQAIAIGLSEAREAGMKVPKSKSGRKRRAKGA
jgi:hypothetical protein